MQECWRGAVERGLAEKSDERSFLPKVRKTLPLKLLKRGHQPSAYPIEKLDRAKGFKPRRQAHISSREEGEVTRRRTLTLLDFLGLPRSGLRTRGDSWSKERGVLKDLG